MRAECFVCTTLSSGTGGIFLSASLGASAGFSPGFCAGAGAGACAVCCANEKEPPSKISAAQLHPTLRNLISDKLLLADQCKLTSARGIVCECSSFVNPLAQLRARTHPQLCLYPAHTVIECSHASETFVSRSLHAPSPSTAIRVPQHRRACAVAAHRRRAAKRRIAPSENSG